MHRNNIVFLVMLILTLLTACAPADNTAPTPTYILPGPLTKTVVYWDLGVSLKYPENWADPVFAAGQLIIPTSPDVPRQQKPSQPLVSLRVIDPVSFNLPKDVKLD